MKRFLLWICAAALTVSSATASNDGIMHKAGTNTPYAGIPGLKQEVKGKMPSFLRSKSMQTLPGLKKSNRMKSAVETVSFPVSDKWKAVASATQYMPEVYGSVIYSDNKSLEVPAVYQLPTTESGEFAFAIEGVNSLYGGVAVDGKYYAQSVEMLWGILEIPFLTVYDIETGAQLAQWMLDGASLAVDFAYNPVDKKVYGLYMENVSEDETTPELVYNIGTVAFPELDAEDGEPVVEKVMDLPTGPGWVSLAIDNTGKFYAVREFKLGQSVTNSRLWSIDIADKTTKNIGAIGQKPKYSTSATFDLATNRLFWTVADAAEKGRLCEINTETGRGTVLNEFSGAEQVVGLYTVNQPVAAGAPAAATNIVANYAAGSKAGNVTFNLPATLFNGEAVQGNLDYVVKANGEEIGKGSGAAGAEMKVEKTFETSGNVRFNVVVSNEAGESPVAGCFAYVGFAEASVPENLVAKEDAVGHVTLTWDPVTTDVNGVVVPEVKYYICTVDGGSIDEIIAEGYTETTYSFQAVPEGEEQAMMQFAVLAECEGGIGAGAATDMIFVGEPYSSFKETFANGAVSYDFILKTNAAQATWGLGTDASGISDQNGDNGFLMHQGKYLDASASIISGKISLKDSKDPVFTCYVYTLVGNDGATQADIVDVAICEVGSEFQSVFNKPVAEIGNTEGWHRMEIDLSAYAGKIIQFKITGLVKMFASLCFDNIYVGSKIIKDMSAIRVTAPAKAKAGEEFDVTVDLLNEGAQEAAASKVNLYVDDVLAQTKDVDPVGVGDAATVDFKVLMPVLAEAPVAIHAEVVMEGDELASNNTTAKLAVAPVVSTLPAVIDLTAKAEGNNVALTWSEPNVETTATGVVDFEDGESFAQSYGDWTFVDGDRATVGGFQNIEIPGIESGSTRASFFVLDSSYPQFNESFTAHSGAKYLAALFNLPAAKCDDWAISPELTGEAQTISFWAKSYSAQYPESFEVMYSTSTTDVSAFKSAGVKVSAVPDEWTEYKAELPAGAKYFAIHYDAFDTFMFMLDDFTFEAKPATPPTLMGFNVYRDGVKLNGAPVEEGAYAETLENDGKYVYAVTALYDKGESKGSNRAEVQIGTSGIEAVATGVVIAAADKAIEISGAEGMAVTVSAIDGKTVFAGEGKAAFSIPVAQGVYVVKAGETVAKIIVR